MSELIDFVPEIGVKPENGFVALTMATPDYAPRMQQLVESAEAHGIQICALEVPSVHRSISPRGKEDSPFSKPALIEAFMKKNGAPTLYLDGDCIISKFPEKLREHSNSSCEFGVYNWLADRENEAYRPILVDDAGSGRRVRSDRYLAYSHCVPLYDPGQLVASGAVQYWAPGQFSDALLGAWRGVIGQYPRCEDDKCLDFAFNNVIDKQGWEQRVAWFEKALCRYAFWFDTEPVINHPDFPTVSGDFDDIAKRSGMARFDPAKAERRARPLKYPRECLIDLEEKLVIFDPRRIKATFAMPLQGGTC